MRFQLVQRTSSRGSMATLPFVEILLAGSAATGEVCIEVSLHAWHTDIVRAIQRHWHCASHCPYGVYGGVHARGQEGRACCLCLERNGTGRYSTDVGIREAHSIRVLWARNMGNKSLTIRNYGANTAIGHVAISWQARHPKYQLR